MTEKINTIYDLILNCKKALPEKPAIICDETVFSYQKFLQTINEFSNFISQKKILSGERAAIIVSDRIEYLVSVYSVMSAGLISVPLSTRISINELSHILKDCHASILITDKMNFESKIFPNISKFNDIKLFVIVDFLGTKRMQEGQISDPNVVLFSPTGKSFQLNNKHVSSDDPALILYTSGTTGKKKGVILTHKNLVETAKYMNSFMQIKENIREFVAVPITHAFGLGRTRALLLTGGTIIIQNGKFDPKRVLNAIKKYQCNALSSVSAVFSIFVEEFHNDFKTIGNNILWTEIGSMPLQVDKKKKLLELFPNARIHMNYGMTEAMRCTLIEFRNEIDKISTVGRASPGVQIKVTDYENNTLPEEEIGEISVKGVNVAKGYWSNQEEWQKKYQDGWIKTDDIGYLDVDGYLSLLGRKDERINVGGQKFYPNEVESLLENILKNFRYCVCGIPDPSQILGEIPVLCIEENKDTNSKPPSINEVEKNLKDKVEQFKIPKMLFRLDVFPLTDNGKIRRHEVLLKIMNQEKTNE